MDWEPEHPVLEGVREVEAPLLGWLEWEKLVLLPVQRVEVLLLELKSLVR